MSEKREQQFVITPSQPEDRSGIWDMANLHDFFKLLLVVDKRINPKLYNPENND